MAFIVRRKPVVRFAPPPKPAWQGAGNARPGPGTTRQDRDAVEWKAALSRKVGRSFRLFPVALGEKAGQVVEEQSAPSSIHPTRPGFCHWRSALPTGAAGTRSALVATCVFPSNASIEVETSNRLQTQRLR